MHFPSLSLLSLLLPFALSASLDERTTCSTANAISDGNFESGVTPSASTANPWKVSYFIGSSSYSLTSPGSTYTTSNVNGGKYAFTASLYPGPYSGGLSAERLSQTLRTCPGQNYTINMDFKFNATAENKCSVGLYYPYKTQQGSITTGSGIPGIEAGVWSRTVGFFQAVTTQDLVEVRFRCEQNARNFISVDRFLVQPYSGNVF